MKYDTERLLDDLMAILKTNLNTKISEIQAEKDSLLGAGNFAVPLIDDEAWFDSLDDKAVNFDPYVYYGVNDQNVIELSSADASEISIFFTVVLHYNGDDASMFRKMLRYIRAMQEVVTANYDAISCASSLTVATITPTDMKDLDGDTFHKIGGVVINTAIG